MEIVELRSDTFTKPTPEMRRAMADAEVGDDVWGEDPTAIALEARGAELFGKQAGLFVPSGTMGNEATMKALTRPGDELIAEETSHIVLYEHGAPSVISGVLIRVVRAPDGRMKADDVRAILAAANDHTSRPTLVWIENTHNFRGGRVVPLEDVRAVAQVAREFGARVFMDGARIFNASVASGTPVRDYAAAVDALSFCFSKGLGAPIGSMVVGPRDLVDEVRVIRQMLGGGMRQVGVLCAAARVALDTGVERLAEDHAHARRLAEAWTEALPGCVDLERVETNMVFAEVGEAHLERIVGALAAEGVMVAGATPSSIRAVTHRDVDSGGISRAIDAFSRAVAPIAPVAA
jgi:threonine aldolase